MKKDQSTTMLVCPGHAIYYQGKWIGGERGGSEEEMAAIFAGHVHEACRMFREHRYGALCVSGGRTRPQDPLVKGASEADGLIAYMREHVTALGIDDAPVLLESYARDSFENVFFSLLAFRQRYNRWPQRIGIVSWKYKILRFYVAAVGLNVHDRFAFYGSGDPAGQAMADVILRESINLNRTIQGGRMIDPLHRGRWFQEKRAGRTPNGLGNPHYLDCVKEAYSRSADLIDMVEQQQPGHWRNARWPW
jgi:hypothetical protein